MRTYACFPILLISLFFSCQGQINRSDIEHLNCQEYWAEVRLTDFCGLNLSNFQLNTLPADICNADQNASYPFDDRVTIRVYNHFTADLAKEEYEDEEAASVSLNGYAALNNVGDDAYGVITTQFGQLNMAIILVIKGTFTIYLEVNGKASNGANNCFDERTVIEFAKALAEPL